LLLVEPPPMPPPELELALLELVEFPEDPTPDSGIGGRSPGAHPIEDAPPAISAAQHAAFLQYIAISSHWSVLTDAGFPPLPDPHLAPTKRRTRAVPPLRHAEKRLAAVAAFPPNRPSQHRARRTHQLCRGVLVGEAQLRPDLLRTRPLDPKDERSQLIRRKSAL